MRTSETTGTLVKALAQAQSEMKNAPMNKENPHFRSKYADLSAVRDATVPALAKHGLAINQASGFAPEHGLVLYTRLSHAEGEWMEAEYPLIVGNPQQMGSALTYARRYCWAAICGIAADEDDDANAASTEPPSEPTRTRATRRTSSPASQGSDESLEKLDRGGPQPAPQPAREHAQSREPAATPAAGPVAKKPTKMRAEQIAQALMDSPGVEAIDDLWKRRLDEILTYPLEWQNRFRAVYSDTRDGLVKIHGDSAAPLIDDINEAVADLEGRIEDERQEELLPR